MNKNILFFVAALFFICCKTNLQAQINSLDWAKSFGGTLSEIAHAIDKDSLGNIYLGGTFSGTVDFDPGVGVFNMTAAASSTYDMFVLKLDPAGNFIWAKKMNINVLNANDGFHHLKVSNDGVYITGAFIGTTDFDPGAGTFNLSMSGSSSWDAFLVKLDLNGNFSWAQRYGNGMMNAGRTIAFDAAQNVHVIGYFSGNTDFDFSGATNTLSSNGAVDGFLLKLSPTGTFIWVKQFTGNGNDDFTGVELDQSGNIYILGSYGSSNLDANPGAGTFYLSSAGASDLAIIKLDAAANFVWAKAIGNSGDNRGVLTYNKYANQVIVTGFNFTSNIDLDPSTSSYTVFSNGGKDIFVAALTGSGNFAWGATFGGAGDDELPCCSNHGVRIDASGRILITGAFSQTVDFNPSATQTFNLTSNGAKDVFLLMLTSGGDLIDAVAVGGSGDDTSYDLLADVNNTYVIGYFSNTADFDPNSGTQNLTSNGSIDAFVMKLAHNLGCTNIVTVYDTITVQDTIPSVVIVYDTIIVHDTITTYVAVSDTLVIDVVLTGVSAPNNVNTIFVYPNPASTHIYIDNGNYQMMGGYSVRIDNALAQTVFSSSVNQQQFYIDVSTWTGTGLYFLYLVDNLGNIIEVKKIVLR